MSSNIDMLNNWRSGYSFTFERATEFANDMTKEYRIYITPIQVTRENRVTKDQIVGGWMLSSEYDPRIVAARKAKTAQCR